MQRVYRYTSITINQNENDPIFFFFFLSYTYQTHLTTQLKKEQIHGQSIESSTGQSFMNPHKTPETWTFPQISYRPLLYCLPHHRVDATLQHRQYHKATKTKTKSKFNTKPIRAHIPCRANDRAQLVDLVIAQIDTVEADLK